jgi:ferric enterobactin receptor
MRAVRVSLAIAALVLLAVPVAAQCRVEGVARTEDGTPLSGAMVRLEIPDVKVPATTTVGEDGRYQFENIKPGTRVHLVVLRDGRLVASAYALVTLRVEPVDIVEYPIAARVASDWDLDPGGGPAGSIAGVVRTASGDPVPGARLVIGETTMTATSDSAGRYVFGRLRSGASVDILASAPGYVARTAAVVVPDADRRTLDFALRRTDASAEPDSQLSPLYSADDTSEVSARAERLRGVPSVGRGDVYRGLQFLPGVWGTSEASGELFVRGGTPGENLITLDGFTLYPVEHVFGPFSALNPDAIAGVDFSRSTVDASDGGRLSGVARMTGGAGGGKAAGAVDFSVLGTRAAVSLPLGKRASFLVAARHSFSGSLNEQFLDMLADDGTTSARDRQARYSGGPLAFEPTSSIGDLNVKFEASPSTKDRVSASFYDASEDANNSRDVLLNRTTSISTPGIMTDLPADTEAQWSDVQTWSARGFSAAWTRRWSPGASTSVSIGRSTTSTDRARSSILTSPTTGIDYSFLGGRAGSDALSDSNRVEDTTLRFLGQLTFGFAHALSFGAEITSVDTTYAIDTEVMRAGASAPTSSLATLVSGRASGRTITGFVQESWRPLTKLTISPGIRLTHYDLAGANYAEPRVALSYELFPRLHLKGGASIDHQEVYRVTYEDRRMGDRELWALADGASIRVPSARQVSGGWSIDFPGLAFDVQAYYKSLEDLTMIAPRLFPGTQVGASSGLRHYGTGTASGIELLVQREWTRNTLWTAYTISRTEYTFPTLEASTFPGSQDQRHEFKVTDSFQIRGPWRCSGAWVIATGRPYTPAESAGSVWFPTGLVVAQATYGARNSARLPTYHRLDLSTERDFRARGMKSTVGVTVFNVYDRDNVRRHGYELAGGTTYDLMYMGRVLNVFARVGF